MEIVLDNGRYNVLENSEILYSAVSEEEAYGFINWKNRPAHDAGNPEECVNC